MTRRVFAAVIVAAGLVALTGCGVYSASSGRVDESLKRIAVQYFENDTAEANLGVTLSDKVIEALQLDNTLKVVDEGSADTILSGTVKQYNRREQFTNPNLTVTEYQVAIAVTLTLARRATGETIFKDKRFTGTGNYRLDGTAENSEENAQSEAIGEIVKAILAQVVEDW